MGGDKVFGCAKLSVLHWRGFRRFVATSHRDGRSVLMVSEGRGWISRVFTVYGERENVLQVMQYVINLRADHPVSINDK